VCEVANTQYPTPKWCTFFTYMTVYATCMPLLFCGSPHRRAPPPERNDGDTSRAISALVSIGDGARAVKNAKQAGAAPGQESDDGARRRMDTRMATEEWRRDHCSRKRGPWLVPRSRIDRPRSRVGNSCGSVLFDGQVPIPFDAPMSAVPRRRVRPGQQDGRNLTPPSPGTDGGMA
jgi:hypothetical protein